MLLFGATYGDTIFFWLFFSVFFSITIISLKFSAVFRVFKFWKRAACPREENGICSNQNEKGQIWWIPLDRKKLSIYMFKILWAKKLCWNPIALRADRLESGVKIPWTEIQGLRPFSSCSMPWKRSELFWIVSGFTCFKCLPCFPSDSSFPMVWGILPWNFTKPLSYSQLKQPCCNSASRFLKRLWSHLPAHKPLSFPRQAFLSIFQKLCITTNHSFAHHPL